VPVKPDTARTRSTGMPTIRWFVLLGLLALPLVLTACGKGGGY
jgi:hypothetical protein